MTETELLVSLFELCKNTAISIASTKTKDILLDNNVSEYTELKHFTAGFEMTIRISGIKKIDHLLTLLDKAIEATNEKLVVDINRQLDIEDKEGGRNLQKIKYCQYSIKEKDYIGAFEMAITITDINKIKYLRNLYDIAISLNDFNLLSLVCEKLKVIIPLEGINTYFSNKLKNNDFTESLIVLNSLKNVGDRAYLLHTSIVTEVNKLKTGEAIDKKIVENVSRLKTLTVIEGARNNQNQNQGQNQNRNQKKKQDRRQ